MSYPQAVPGSGPLWPRSTTLFLVMVGVALSLLSFLIVLVMPALVIPAAGDSTGTPEALAAARSGGVLFTIGISDSAWKIAQAFTIAVPLVWLPLAVARIFRRARAGYALVLLPPIMWLLNNGTILVGTEYGLTDQLNPWRVSVLQGLPASVVFLGLSLLLWASTARLRVGALVLVSIGVSLLAVLAGLLQDVAGIGVALAVGVLWWVNSAGRMRWTAAILSSLVALALALSLQIGIAAAIGAVESTNGAALDALPYDGLSETWKWYLEQLLFVIKSFGAPIAFVLVGFTLVLTRRGLQRRALGAAFAVTAPSLVIGIAVPVVTVPTLSTFGILVAALGILIAVALGGLVWSLTSMPSHVRALERQRLSHRRADAADAGSGMSAIVPTRNGGEVIEATVGALAGRLVAGDEIIVVENGSTDDTSARLDRLASEWTADAELVVLHSAPGLGEALRTGVLASRGARLLLSADDLPFGFSDLDGFERLPASVVVAIGSKAHPDSQVDRHPRRMLQSRIFRFLRSALLQSRVGDSQGTIWTDGRWGRSLALHSRETGLMWTTELVLAAEQQGVEVREVPVRLQEKHESGASRFRFSDAWSSVIGFTRLAVYKDDYCGEDWTRTPPSVEGEPDPDDDASGMSTSEPISQPTPSPQG